MKYIMFLITVFSHVANLVWHVEDGEPKVIHEDIEDDLIKLIGKS